MNKNMLPQNILNMYRLNGTPKEIFSGTNPIYQIDRIVLKRISQDSIEVSDFKSFLEWYSKMQTKINMRQFRIPFIKSTGDNQLIANDNWTAWTFLEGKPECLNHIPMCIESIISLHKEFALLSKEEFLNHRITPWEIAHHKSLEADVRNEKINSLLAPYIDELYSYLEPIPELKNQIIHGDINLNNILISKNSPPAIIDISPFWGPPEFALAIFANFIGPRRGDIKILKHFENIPFFRQLILRAGLRMLFIMDEINDLKYWENSPEKKACELIVDYLSCNEVSD